MCQIPKDYNEISRNYVITGKRCNWTNIVAGNISAYNVTPDIISENEDPEPKLCGWMYRQRKDWSLWKEAIGTELNSLSKSKVFRLVFQTLEGVKHVRYKWTFVRKRNKNDEVTRYKTRLVAQGFSQRLDIGYEGTYFLIVNAIILRFLIGLPMYENLDVMTQTLKVWSLLKR